MKTKYISERHETFACRLRCLMREHSLNQIQFSKLIGIRQSQVSNWLNEKSAPGYHSLCVIKEKLELEWVELFEG